MCSSDLEKKPPIIFGNGTQIRDFIFVEDVAKANLAAMKSTTNSGFFNVGTGVTTSIIHLACIMIDLSGLNMMPQFENPLEGDVQNSQADITLSKKTLDWHYSTELKDGLAKFFPLSN